MNVVDAGTYRVTIGRGALHEVGRVAAAAVPSAHRWVIITDETVEPLWRARVESSFPTPPLCLRIPAGEAHKTRESWAALTDAMIDAGIGRDSAVLALGGGVIGDVAGFVAATFHRGVPVVQVPTTLLAMVDASIGGKTGLDVPGGKNLVGAFHPPSAVVIDPTVLGTLPLEDRRAGIAEMLKHGIVADAEHFAWLVSHAELLVAADAPTSDLLAEAIAISVRIKAEVVRRDAREAGLRKVLNFGHTAAHAIEHLLAYGIRHGEAVAIGMVLEARVAEALDIAAAGTATIIRDAVRSVGLPDAVPSGISREALVRAMHTDKKARGGVIECALPARIGAMAGEARGFGIPVADSDWFPLLP
ncbi:MAG: 3-dehydroquinate synthase [Gemmatimonadaceae bacterium]|nr:3-dehydroquinate synthase [Gemmatimonadaceae bacterium]